MFIIESGLHYDLYTREISVESGLYVRQLIGIFLLKSKKSKVESIILYGQFSTRMDGNTECQKAWIIFDMHTLNQMFAIRRRSWIYLCKYIAFFFEIKKMTCGHKNLAGLYNNRCFDLVSRHVVQSINRRTIAEWE